VRELKGRLFISWVRDHGRSRDLANALGAKAVFLTSPGRAALKRYVVQSIATYRILSKDAPALVLVMQPPVVALFPVLIYAWRRDCVVVGDLHTGAFNDPKWRWATDITLRLLRHGGIIVTNQALADYSRAKGTPAFALDDLVTDRQTDSAHRDPNLVLCPVSYANDEPLEVMLRAAASTPDLQWVLTGTPPDSIRAAAPPNVVFPGYVPTEEYDALVARSGVVVALTTREETMQRAGYEAIETSAPLITSRTRVLIEYFADAAVFVPADGPDLEASLVGAVRDVLGDVEGASRAMHQRLLHQLERQATGLAELQSWLTR
jgi:hypothetical protein